jgi:hypothetical protein
MCAAEIDADRLGDIIVGNLDDPFGATLDDGKGRFVRHAHRHAVGKGQCRIGRDHMPRRERQRVGIGALCDDPDDLGFQAERIAHADDPGNPEPSPIGT